MAEKLQKALNYLLIENYTIQDKTLLEKLLTCLYNEDILLKTIPIENHLKWFTSVLNVYKQQTPITKNWAIHLYAFALKYLSILVKSNDGLVALIETQTLQSMINQLDVATNFKESSVFNAYILLLQTLNTHIQGIEYVFQEGLWKNILFAINGLIIPAKYVEIQSSQYIADLIYKSFEHGMAHYCEPLFKDLFLKLNSIDNLIGSYQVNDFSAYNVYIKTLILSLEKFVGTKYESDVCLYIIEKYSLSDVLVNIQKLSNVNPMLLKNYMTLHLLFDTFTTWHHSDMEFILKLIGSRLSMVKDTRSYKQMNYLCVQAIRYANITNTQLSGNIQFEKELIIAQIIPLKKYSEWLKCKQNDNEEFIFDENSGVIESKLIYNCFNSSDSMMNEVAVSSILNIIDIVPILKQESLDYLIIFMSKLTNQYLHPNNWKTQTLEQGLTYYKVLEILRYVFICWAKLLEYKLCIDNIVQNNLLIPLIQNHSHFLIKIGSDSTLLQNGLQLISTALKKRIYENAHCTDYIAAFDKLCSTFQNFLLDTRPEIRDSSLQCISSVIIGANYKSGNFFINLMIEKNLPIDVLNTLKHDNDPFVRAMAVECLEKMVSISDIWETSLKESDLINHCLFLMQYEHEGIIRRQIVKLLTAIFNSNELSKTLFNQICVLMVHISVNDPLWEVKIFAYEFWDLVIKKLVIKKSCIHNGTKTLNYSLIELSTTGCLHVLYVALKEEHDLAVQKKAIYITKELLSYISSTNMYRSMSDLNMEVGIESENCVNNINENEDDSETNSEIKKSRQIDSTTRVLNTLSVTSDCELLCSLKNANRSNIYPDDVSLVEKSAVYISVDDFLSYTDSYNFNDCCAKTEWVISTRSGLDSMLSDIIGYSTNSFVEGADLLDCY
ncbi:Hypothetical protein CINCED_3A021537 [Cinara cedri]|nr:Hypothetical protein CINCED_3A021537 [Cinara cedri]